MLYGLIMGFLLYKSYTYTSSYFINYFNYAPHCALSYSIMLRSCAIHQGSESVELCQKLRAAAYQLNRSSYYNPNTEQQQQQQHQHANNRQINRQQTDKLSLLHLE